MGQVWGSSSVTAPPTLLRCTSGSSCHLQRAQKLTGGRTGHIWGASWGTVKTTHRFRSPRNQTQGEQEKGLLDTGKRHLLPSASAGDREGSEVQRVRVGG